MRRRFYTRRNSIIGGAVLLLALLTGPVAAQTSFTGIYEFTGNTGCPTVNDEVTTQPSEATFSTFSRTGVVCNSPSAGEDYTNKEWAETTTLDPTKYVSFTVSANPTFSLSFQTSDLLTFSPTRSSTGPTSGEVRYSVDGGSFQTLGAFTPDTPASLNMPALSGVSSIEFRFYGWNSEGAGGKLAFDDVQLTGSSEPVAMPVELVAFDALTDGADVLLTWATASETNNAGFEVQMLPGTAPGDKTQNEARWTVLGWVDGHGTTLEAQAYQYRIPELAPGSYTFRLKQIDYDGTFDYSPEVEITAEMAERFLVEPVYPNPFNPQAVFRFAVRQQQAVRVELFDVLGRRVALLYAGEPEAGQMQTVRIDGAGLPSGRYLVRVLGEGFARTQAVTLLK